MNYDSYIYIFIYYNHIYIYIENISYELNMVQIKMITVIRDKNKKTK